MSKAYQDLCTTVIKKKDERIEELEATGRESIRGGFGVTEFEDQAAGVADRARERIKELEAENKIAKDMHDEIMRERDRYRRVLIWAKVNCGGEIFRRASEALNVEGQ